MTWLNNSEIVTGLVLEGRISPHMVREEIFFPPYDNLIKLKKKDPNITPEEIIEKCGLELVSSAHEAVKNMNGIGELNWVKILEKSYSMYSAGQMLEKKSKKLLRGEDIDWSEITDITRKAQEGMGGDFTTLDEIKGGKIPFISSGWPVIDKHLGGWPEVGVVLIGGEPGSGKTTFIIRAAIQFAKQYPDKKVAIFSLEMILCELATRFREIEKLDKDVEERILLNETPLNADEITNKAATIENLGLVIADFADLMVEENTEAAYAKMYRTLMFGSKQLHAPYLIPVQLLKNKTGYPRPIHLRYCLPASARIFTSSGKLLSPTEITSQDKTISYDNGKLVFSDCDGHENTIQPIIEVITKQGFKLLCSEDHPILTEDGWLEAKNLPPGTLVATIKRFNVNNGISYSHERARLLGYIIGDGYTPSKGKGGTSYVEPSNIIVADFESCINKEFPNIKLTKKWHRNAWKIDITNKHKGSKTNDFCFWLEEMTVRGTNSHTRFVPNCVFSWDNPSIGNFLCALFTADGTINQLNKYGHVSLFSVSSQLLQDIKILLTRFGITSSISSGHISIAGKKKLHLFSDCIGFVGDKQTKLNKLLKIVGDTDSTHDTSDILPLRATKLYREFISTKLSKTRRITKARFKSNAVYIPPSHSEEFLHDDVSWEEIKSIRCIGNEMTYDLTVPKYENFIVDGIVTHNTKMAEAFAWMILMIYDPSKDFDTEDDAGILPIRRDAAYILVWKIRGGAREHKESFPGAILLPFRGDAGWGIESKQSKWYSLQKV